MLNISYQDFVAKNEANKQNFKNAVKTGQLNLNLVDPYVCSTIEQVDRKCGDGIVDIRPHYQSWGARVGIPGLVSRILNSDVIHVTNPSKIKGCFSYK